MQYFLQSLLSCSTTGCPQCCSPGKPRGLCVTLHYITLHYIKQQNIILHHTTLHNTTLHITLHCMHYIQIQICRYIDMQICRYIDMQICIYIYVCVDMQIFFIQNDIDILSYLFIYLSNFNLHTTILVGLWDGDERNEFLLKM